MRSFFRKYTYHEIETELNYVQNVLSSNMYVFVDLIFISLIISFFMAIFFESILFGIIIFVCSYLFFVAIYCLLLKLIKDSPDDL
ncbi:hypothetical protein M1D49_11370 [Bacillus sp. PK3-056]|uniref:hypothetical protein n=1 Tax=Niallia circulans TaxID=1397 RepID=UPI000F448E42|nr:hypothetical protein [Niallia circulans]AYV70365.1 hypothetical protein C2H98_01585 [Niallia circulans]